MTNCAFTGCGRAKFARNLCHTHYQQLRSGRDLREIRPRRNARATAVRNERGDKHCPKCDLWYPEAQYAVDPSHTDGLSTYCKACRSAAMRAWRFGTTPGDLMRMVHDQGGSCATCPAPLADGFCVDHDHSCCGGARSCGECIRGLLCGECNKLLGKIESDAERMRKMLAYIGWKE